MPNLDETAELRAALATLTHQAARTTNDHMLALDIANKFVLHSIVEEVERWSPGFAQRLSSKLDLLARITDDREQAEAFESAHQALAVSPLRLPA